MSFFRFLHENSTYQSEINRHLSRFFLIFVAMLLLFVMASGVFAEGKLTPITFSLDWTPNTNHTGVYAAKALGYYEEAGLDVRIVQPPDSGALLMCAAGQAQFAVDAQDTMAASLDLDEPLGITAVAAILQHNTSGIISRSGDGITSAKGLEGRIYATWDSPIELAMIRYCMENEGADFDTLRLIPNNITDEPAAVTAHQTDAIWIFYGWSGINAEVNDFDFDYWDFRSISEDLDYYTPVIIANNEFLNNSPEIAEAFLSATRKGYEYAIEHPEEAAEILIAGDTTGSLNDARELVYASQKWLSDQYKSDAESWGIFDSDRWDRFYSWLYTNGLTAHDLTGKGYSNEYLP